MLIALTGTPGTGKFTVAPRLKAEGLKVIGDGGPARRRGALVGYHGRTGTGGVDLEPLEAAIPERRPLILGHSSHLLSVDLTIVLWRQPDVLRGRREEGSRATAKVRDNVEAEALGVISQDTFDRTRTWQIDTTHRAAEETATAVMGIVEGKTWS